MRYHFDTLSGTVDLTCKTPDAILLIRNNRLLVDNIPSQHIHEAGIDAGLAAGTFFSVDFNVGIHAASKTELL
jgi:hypothetical protein